jgi:hypothetical protein
MSFTKKQEEVLDKLTGMTEILSFSANCPIAADKRGQMGACVVK